MSIRKLNRRFPDVFNYKAGDQYTAGTYGGLDDEYYVEEIIGINYDDYLGKHNITSDEKQRLIQHWIDLGRDRVEAEELAREEIEHFTEMGWIEEEEPTKVNNNVGGYEDQLWNTPEGAELGFCDED